MAAKGQLSEYLRKRDFAKTPEPKGTKGPVRRTSLGFFVQKHAATRLHYDLRLEWGGVLLSWAVTRGPSADPSQKRLAVRTEDHPMSYADFEGTIPKTEYGGGTVMLWDRGQWTPHTDASTGLLEGKLKFSLEGERLQGHWMLVRMKSREAGDGENWLLIKERDEHASDDPDELVDAFATSVATARTMDQIAGGVRAEPKNGRRRPGGAATPGVGSPMRPATARPGTSVQLPSFRKPQLATLSDTVPQGEDWLHESKFDGYRCIAAVAGDEVRCYSRSGLDWTDKFRSIAKTLPALDCQSALLDGEVVAPAVVAGSQFSALQNALTSGGALALYAFDLLELNGEELSERPLLERKALLRNLVASLPHGANVVYSEHVRGKGKRVLDAMCQEGREGIISKKANSEYRNRRTTTWLKLKCTRRQEFVIGGFSPSDKRGREFASLLLGTFEGDDLSYRGRVGSGFSEEDLQQVGQKLQKLHQSKPPFDTVPAAVARSARWVRPQLVAEIDFAELTDAGHVRHGVFKGLRADKRAGEVTLERPASGDAKMKEEYRGVRISSPHRVVYSEQGVTKIELAGYYNAVGERMLPHVANHPLSLVRCPKGRNDECFFQKHASPGFPDELKRVKLQEKSGKRADYLYVDSVKGLIAAVQMGTLEFHVWGSKTDALEKPDRLVFDLDPDESLNFPVVSLAAAVLRQKLQQLGLKTVALVTGGKGVHVIAPLRRTADWAQVKAFAQGFATGLASDEPDVFTATMSKSRRRGRIFIDWFRNERGSTAIAPWSTRAREKGPVATPVSWDELADLEGANCFHIGDVLRRLDDDDPWAEAAKWRQSVTRPMVERVSG